MKKTDWVEIIANEIRGPDIPPDAQNARMLAKAWGLSTKGAYNKCEELVKKGVLAFVEGKREGDQRKSRFYAPAESFRRLPKSSCKRHP